MLLSSHKRFWYNAKCFILLCNRGKWYYYYLRRENWAILSPDYLTSVNRLGDIFSTQELHNAAEWTIQFLFFYSGRNHQGHQGEKRQIRQSSCRFKQFNWTAHASSFNTHFSPVMMYMSFIWIDFIQSYDFMFLNSSIQTDCLTSVDLVMTSGCHFFTVMNLKLTFLMLSFWTVYVFPLLIWLYLINPLLLDMFRWFIGLT